MPSWPQSSRHHGQGPRPTTGKRYGIGGFRGMNPQPGPSHTMPRHQSIPIFNKTRGIHNSNEIIKNSPQSGNRYKKASDNISSTPMNISTPTDTEVQHVIEGKSKAWQYLEKWQHTTKMPKDSFKTEIDHERLRSSDQIARSRGAGSPRKHDNVNINKNKMGIDNKKKFSGQHSASHMSLNLRDISYMHERSLSPQQKRRKIPLRHSSGNRNSPGTLDTNRNLPIYGLSSSIENISTSLRNKHSKDSSILYRYSGNINPRSHTPGSPNERYHSVKEFEDHKNNKLRRSYSLEKEGFPDRNYSGNRDHSPYNETVVSSRRQPLVQHTSRHILHHRSPTSDRQHCRRYSPEFDISPPRVQSPESKRSFSRQSSPSRELSLSRRWSPSKDYEHTKSHSLARRLESSKVYNDEKDIFHHDSLLKGRSPMRQSTSFFQEKYEKHKPEHSGMRDRPKEYYDSRVCKRDRSLSPTGYHVKFPMTRGRSQERILKHKSHRRMSPHEQVHKHASPPARNISPRRSRVLPKSRDQYSVEVSRLSPQSFLQNMNALHKEYSPVLTEKHEQDDGYRSRDGSRASSLERFLFPDKRYRDENTRKNCAKADHGLERYEDSHVLEEDTYSHRMPISERLGSVFDSPDREEDDVDNFPIQVETEEKDLRRELIKIKEKKVEEKIRELEETERETDYKLSILERKLDRKEHEDKIRALEETERETDYKLRILESKLERKEERKEHEDLSAKMREKKRSSQSFVSNRSSRVNDYDIQLRTHKSSMTRNAYSDNRKSGKYNSARSADASPHSRKGEPTTADSGKKSRSLVEKKDSLPLKEPRSFSPIQW